MTPRRGEVWLVDFGDPVGHEQGYRRPAVIVSSNDLKRGLAGLAIVVATTSTARSLAAHVELESGETGLDVTS